MMRMSRKSIAAMLGAATAVVISASLAFACVALVGFSVVGTGTVAPGGTVQVVGTEFARGLPVAIHLDAPTGPILATFPSPQPSSMTSSFTLDVPIPANISAGPHLLVATQDHFDHNVGIPARATIYVNSSPPVAGPPDIRPVSLAVDDGPGSGSYILVGLGVAAGGLLVAGFASLLASKRGTPKAAAAKA